MKAKTKQQKQVFALFNKLPEVGEGFKRLANRNTVGRYAFRSSRKNAWCSCCGKSFTPTDDKKVTCPHCGEELEVKESRQLTYSPIGHWVSYLTTAGGYQIERFFLLEYYIRKGSEPHTSVKEFLVRFMNGKGTQYIVSRRRSMYYDNFCMHSDFEIRDSGMFECVLSDYTYHTGRLINELKRRNFHVHDTDCAFLVAKRFLSEGAYERLWKLGQYKFAQDMLFRGGIERYYNQLRICSRNGYIVNDTTLWRDVIDNLRELGLDTNSPKYICSDNLEQLHNHLLGRIERKRKAERLKEMLATIQHSEKKYRRNRFIGFEIRGEKYDIHVLRTVREFYEEGEAMHHCVFTNGYYDKKQHPDCVILSVRDKDGSRLETAEISTRTWTISQCRGLYNRATEDHNEIVGFLTENMNKLRTFKTTKKY